MHRTVNVYLTTSQLSYLGSEDGHDVVIETVDDGGGLFLHNAENAGEEGSGVWVDADGNEHYSPGNGFVLLESEQRARINKTVDVNLLKVMLGQVAACTDDAVEQLHEEGLHGNTARMKAATQANEAVMTVRAWLDDPVNAGWVDGMELPPA